MPNNDEKKVLLKVTDLKQWFPLKKTKLFQKEQEYVRANDGITLNIYEGETVGLVGESGCGKSTFGRTLLQIYKQTEGDAIIVTEVGQHQMWAAQYYKFTKPRTLLTSGGLGTMGYGLGAAIGAKMGRPEKTVVNIAGDGCFRMNMNEVATAARYNIPIIQVVVNNHVLGMVRQWQNLFYGQRYSATVLNDAVDFVKLAEAMGAKAVRATTREEFADAFKFALNAGGPVVIDCQIDSDDKVWPMVAPGAPISEAFDEKDLQEKQQIN